MIENKRWIIHKIGNNGLGLFDLIDTKNKRAYDYDVSYEICEKTIDLLNYQNKEIEQLEKENEQLKAKINFLECPMYKKKEDDEGLKSINNKELSVFHNFVVSLIDKCINDWEKTDTICKNSVIRQLSDLKKEINDY